MTINETFTALEQLLKEMEDPDLSLEASFEKYNKGLELIGYCNDSIDKIEKQITILEENRT